MSSIPPPLPPGSFPTGPPTPPPSQPSAAPSTTPVKSANSTVFVVVAAVVIFALVAWAASSFRSSIKSAGFDPLLMQTNPGLAMAKMAVALNPNLELVSYDERTGTISMREKSSGQVIVYRFDPEKQELVISTADGKSSIKGTETGVTFESRTGDGTLKIGEGADRPGAWVPAYPGSTPQAQVSTSSDGRSTFGYSFDTKDEVSKVLDFFTEKLTPEGFTFDRTLMAGQGVLIAEHAEKKKSLQVFVNRTDDATHVNITANEQK